MFYVREAATEVDMHGRKIIAAQDFVQQYGVKTVFGFGGGYIGKELFMTTIIFLRETLEEKQALLCSNYLAFFKQRTTELIFKKILN